MSYSLETSGNCLVAVVGVVGVESLECSVMKEELLHLEIFGKSPTLFSSVSGITWTSFSVSSVSTLVLLSSNCHGLHIFKINFEDFLEVN